MWISEPIVDDYRLLIHSRFMAGEPEVSVGKCMTARNLAEEWPSHANAMATPTVADNWGLPDQVESDAGSLADSAPDSTIIIIIVMRTDNRIGHRPLLLPNPANRIEFPALAGSHGTDST